MKMNTKVILLIISMSMIAYADKGKAPPPLDYECKKAISSFKSIVGSQYHSFKRMMFSRIVIGCKPMFDTSEAEGRTRFSGVASEVFVGNTICQEELTN